MDFRRLLAKRPRKILALVCTLPVHFWLGLDSGIFARAGGGKADVDKRNCVLAGIAQEGDR
jgi:hypothetical protein